MRKLKINKDLFNDEEYIDCIRDLIDHEVVCSMKNYIQHSSIDCLEHSLNVSYNSYLICKHMMLDYRSAARGGCYTIFFYMTGMRLDLIAVCMDLFIPILHCKMQASISI